MKKVMIIGVIIMFVCLGINILLKKEIGDTFENNDSIALKVEKPIIKAQVSNSNNNKIDDWRLILVNYENILPEDFEIQLANIDDTRKFDVRAIVQLNQMLEAMKQGGISNIWVQSAYRSVEYQQNLFFDKINTYMKHGKEKDEAEKLALHTINKPGTSEHNLGLAVDFNYVDYSFDDTKGFKWLEQNAENYGFILRYKSEKQEITKVDYEPWHWRYVGLDNAKKMNELNMCLEEYIEFLENK